MPATVVENPRGRRALPPVPSSTPLPRPGPLGMEPSHRGSRHSLLATQQIRAPRRLIDVRLQVFPIARSVLIRLGLIGLVFLLVEIVLPDVLAAVAR